jgi:hypothetical protein
MSVSEASMSAKTFAGFPNDRRIAIVIVGNSIRLVSAVESGDALG